MRWPGGLGRTSGIATRRTARRAAIRLKASLSIPGLVLLCAQVETATARALDESSVKAVLSGAKIETVTVRTNRPLSMTFAPDGVLHGSVSSPDGVVTQRGTWWITSLGAVCWQWKDWAGGRKLCARLERVGNKLRRTHAKTGAPLRGADWMIVVPGASGQTGPATAEPVGALPPGHLDADGIWKSLAGAAIQGHSNRANKKFELALAVNGSASVAIGEGESSLRDTGRWWITPKNTFCFQFDKFASGKVRCFFLVLEGTRIARYSARTLEPLDGPPWQIVKPASPGQIASATAGLPGPDHLATLSATPGASVKLRPRDYAAIHFGTYHALVIGNNRYKDLTPLKTAKRDARAVADVLRRSYGFKVRLLLDATRADLIEALTDLRGQLTADDNLLIYYAGHGELDEIAEQGYWLPIDAEADVPTNWVSTSDVTVMVRAIRAKHILVVADSCYSGTLVRDANLAINTAAGHAWLKRMASKRARTALVSGGLEPVLDGGGDGHSVFARAFLNALRENGGVMDGQTLFDRIKRPIVVNADQTPQYSDIRRAGHDGGDFLFVRRN